MKLTSLLSVKEDVPAQKEHALLTLLKNAGKEIQKDIDYDFSDGTMDYHHGLLMVGKSTLFDNHGRCLAESSEILDHAENEKVILLAAGYDGNWEQAYIVPTSAEMVVRKSTYPGKYIVSFRGMKFDFTREEAEKVFTDFVDTELFEYERIGDRVEYSWNDNFDEDTPRWSITSARNSWLKNREDDYHELGENDYKFEKEAMYGALIYKDLHHH